MHIELEEAARQVRAGIRQATKGLIGREQLGELIVLAAVAQEHLLVIGPPGTAKSAVVRRVAQALGGSYFEYLLGRFTEPSEIFGPVNLHKLREGTVETDTAGMLPEADVAFLDEVFLGSTAILNTLLGVLNERRFRRGHTSLQCPLRVCVGAANGLPDDPGLAAFADRFLLHAFVDAVPDHQLEELLAGGWQSGHQPPTLQASLTQLDILTCAVPGVEMAAIRPGLANALRRLRDGGLHLSDRRIVKSQQLIAAATVLAGRTEATEADLWPLLYVMPTREAQHRGRDILGSLLASCNNPTLGAAVEAAVLQPQSRVSRLIEEADALLTGLADGQPLPAQRLEPVMREIDANFDADTLPKELAERRQRLLALSTLS